MEYTPRFQDEQKSEIYLQMQDGIVFSNSHSLLRHFWSDSFKRSFS